jgi:glycosyltransferase involved in cell wall biosynthesis
MCLRDNNCFPDGGEMEKDGSFLSRVGKPKEFERLDIAVVVPALNEEKSMGPFLSRLKDVFGDPFLLVVDGNSCDGTAEIAKELGAEIIFQKGKGKGAALCEAFHSDCLRSDFVLIMDADESMDPQEAPLLVKALMSGADVAKGSRFLLGGYSKDLTLVRRIGNTILVSLVNLLWSTNYTDLCYGFIGFKREALKKISSRLKSKNFDVEAEICIKAKKLGLKTVEVPSVEHPRRHGQSKLRTFRDGFDILKKILVESFRRY